jgi:hypothetical protein
MLLLIRAHHAESRPWQSEERLGEKARDRERAGKNDKIESNNPHVG